MIVFNSFFTKIFIPTMIDRDSERERDRERNERGTKIRRDRQIDRQACRNN